MENRPGPSKIEDYDLFFEVGLFAGAIVDHIHGSLPASIPMDHPTRNRIRTLFQRALDEGSRLASSEDQRWSEICLARRILNRVLRALSSGAHRHAVDLGLTEATLGQVRTLAALVARVNAKVVDRASHLEAQLPRTIQTQEEGDQIIVPWEDIAVIYEASLIHRAKGDVQRAIELANSVFSWIENEVISVIHPGSSSDGELPPFLPMMFSDDLAKAAGSMMTLSRAISHQSKYARAAGITPASVSECGLFVTIPTRILEMLNDGQLALHYRALPHLESLLRVCIYQAAWSLIPSKETTVYSKSKLCDLTFKLYDHLERQMDLIAGGLEPVVSEVMRASFQQNMAVLISEIAPEYTGTLPEADEGQSRPILDSQLQDWQSTEFLRRVRKSIEELGWDVPKLDAPAHLKSRYRQNALEDVFDRSRQLIKRVDGSILDGLRDLLGDPTSLNLSKGGGSLYSDFVLDSKSRSGTDSKHNSLHLAHLPQGGINRAQVAIAMAYMLSIMRSQFNTSGHGSARHGDFGSFTHLDRLFVSMKEDPGLFRMTRDQIPGKLQVTLNHKNSSKDEISLAIVADQKNQLEAALRGEPSKSEAKKIKQELSAIGAEYRRANLSRVHRHDGMMMMAKALNDLQDVLENQLGEVNFQERLNNATRRSKVDDHLFGSAVQPPHVYECLYLAIDAQSSPLRILEPHSFSLNRNEGYSQSAIVNAVLRASMARLYCLSVRTEILARMLLERPLREPYQSASVLILDQIRVLLRFYHTDWLQARETFQDDESHSYRQEIADGLNLFSNERRQRLFDTLDLIEFTYDEVRQEPAVSYVIEYGVESTDACIDLMTSSKSRLDFENSELFGDAWTIMFHDSLELHKEHFSISNPDELATQIAPEEDDDPADSLPTERLDVEQAMAALAENTDREWILWARLALFPVCFVGRSLLSGTTTKDLNLNLVPDEDSTDSIANPMLFNLVKRAIEDG